MKTRLVDRGGTPRSLFHFTKWIIAACALVAANPAARAGAEVRLSLSDAISRAGDHAALVQAAEHDSIAAGQALRAAKSEWFPSLAVTGNAFGFNPVDALGIGFLQIPSRWNSVYVTNFSLRYPIFTGGRRTHTIRGSNAGVEAAASQLDAERLSAAYECRSAYLRLLVADRMVAAAEASLRRVELIGTDVRNRFIEGMADSVDVLETQLSLRRVSRSLETTRNQRRNASAALARLIGTPADEPIVPTETIPEPASPSEAGIPEPDATARPELRVFDRRLEALAHERSVVRGNYLPVVNGLGGYAVVRPDIGQPDVDWRSLWWVGVTLSWDLNLGGGEAARSEEVLERIRSLEMVRADAERAFTLQAHIARNDIDEAYRLYQLSREEYSIASDRYRLADLKASAGTITVNRLVELESELTETEQEYEVARLRYFLAITEYLRAIGSDAIREAM